MKAQSDQLHVQLWLSPFRKKMYCTPFANVDAGPGGQSTLRPRHNPENIVGANKVPTF
jgi:hypothetical protein